MSAITARLWQSLDLPYRQLFGEAYWLYAMTTLPTSIIAETKYKGLLSQKKLQIILAEDNHGSA